MQATKFYTVIADQNGRLYAGGVAWDAANNGYWIVARSTAADGFWDNVTVYQAAPGLNAQCYALAVSSQGDIYASGQVIFAKEIRI